MCERDKANCSKLENFAPKILLCAELGVLSVRDANLVMVRQAIWLINCSVCRITPLRLTTCQVVLAVLHALADKVGNVPRTTDLLYPPRHILMDSL